MKITEKYSIKTESLKNKPNEWDSLCVSIFLNKPDESSEKIGEYKRNYHTIYNTFLPFKQNGKEYALYSMDYQTTSVMSLPDCKHIASCNNGFCPVDYMVYESYYDENDKIAHPSLMDEIVESMENEGMVGLVAGCVWGDDSGGWKVMGLNLKELEKGKINYISFGYFQLPCLSLKLKDLVEWEDLDRLEIATTTIFHIDGEVFTPVYIGCEIPKKDDKQ